MGYYVAEGAILKGNISFGEDASIWYHATIRGDSDIITIGEKTNIQDNVVIHVTKGFPVHIGSHVTVGHSAIVHGCSVGENTLIGMGAIILNGAQIGKNCIIGAGALVTQNMNIPDGSLAYGNPAKIQRNLKQEEIDEITKNAIRYVEAAKDQLILNNN